MLTIIASLDQEMSPLNKALKSGRNGLAAKNVAGGLHVIGVGRSRATANVSTLLGRPGDGAPSENERRRILMLGFAGAVEPTLKLGDLVLSSRYYRPYAEERRDIPVSDTGNSDDAASSGWLDGICRKEVGSCFLEPDRHMWQVACNWAGNHTKTWSRSDSLTVTRIDESAQRKTEVRSTYPVGIVDMEDYWVAAAARESGVPFLSARVVLDEAHQALPGYLVGMTDSPVRAAASVSVMPWRLPTMLGLARRIPMAQQCLTEFALGFISDLEDDKC